MNRRLERMRYKNDKLSSGLCLLAIAFDIAYFIMIYASSTIVPDAATGIDVIINILFMLVAFWASEQAKVYDRKWSFGIMALGVVQFARLLWLPEKYNELGQLVGVPYLMVRVMLIGSIVTLLASGIICFTNSTSLKKYLSSGEASSSAAGQSGV